jgi:hypothetical protein
MGFGTFPAWGVRTEVDAGLQQRGAVAPYELIVGGKMQGGRDQGVTSANEKKKKKREGGGGGGGGGGGRAAPARICFLFKLDLLSLCLFRLDLLCFGLIPLK